MQLNNIWFGIFLKTTLPCLRNVSIYRNKNMINVFFFNGQPCPACVTCLYFSGPACHVLESVRWYICQLNMSYTRGNINTNIRYMLGNVNIKLKYTIGNVNINIRYMLGNISTNIRYMLGNINTNIRYVYVGKHKHKYCTNEISIFRCV